MGSASTGAKAFFVLVLGALVAATLVFSILTFLKLKNDNSETGSHHDTPMLTTAAPATPAPSAPPVTLYPYVFNYDGQFTDSKSVWNKYYGVPGTTKFRKLQEKYQSTIQSLIDKNFHDTYAYVSYFSNDADHVRVNFIVTMLNISNPHAPSAKSFQIDLENSAVSSGYVWTAVIINNEQPQPPVPASQERGWKDAAQMFMAAINTSVDPCDDFYTFSCSKWIEDHPLNTTSGVDHFSVLQDKIDARMQQLLESFPTDGSKGPKSVQMASAFYRTCVTSNSSEYKGAARLMGMLDGLGGWPIIAPTDTWTAPTDFGQDLARLMGTLSNNYSVASFFSPGVEVDVGNVSRNALSIGSAEISIPPNVFLSDPESYILLLTRIIAETAITLAGSAGLQPDVSSVVKDAGTVAQLEYILAASMSTGEGGDSRNQSQYYHPYDIATASDRWPEIDWVTYLEALTHGRGVPADSLEPFVIGQPSYVTNLNEFFAQMGSSEDVIRGVYNYLIWRFVNRFDVFGGPEFYKMTANLRQIRNPTRDSLPPPPGLCTQMIQGVLPWAAGRLYVDNEFTTAERMKAGVMVAGVLSAFRGQLSGLKWMDDFSKLLSIKKIYYMVKNVGYPDFIMNDALLDEYYAQMNDQILTDPNIDFMDVYFDVIDFQWDKEVKKLGAVPDRTDFLSSPTIVNAWYAPWLNSINLPAAILNQPFFRADFPMAVNYGGMGVVMAHELTHGFDDQGVQFDYDGSLRNWMTSTSKEGFNEMAQCAVDEYSDFCYDIDQETICVNGQATQGENIADNGGIKAAYQAYKAYVASNGDELRLPGMESYTMEQIFFLSFSHVWCSVHSDDYLQRQLLLDPHSPAPARVVGTLRNFEPFAAAFGCRPGDQMYPRQHCNVW